MKPKAYHSTEVHKIDNLATRLQKSSVPRIKYKHQYKLCGGWEDDSLMKLHPHALGHLEEQTNSRKVTRSQTQSSVVLCPLIN